MFRYRLALVILICFGFVLFLGVALYWGTNQVNRLFQHSQAAYDTFDRYERLSQESYRHFKQRMDRLIINSAAAKDGVDSSRRRLYEAMQDLRISATEPGPQDRADEPGELQRVARFTAFLDSSKYQFDKIEKLSQQGKIQQAVQALSKFSEQEIDAKFQPMIDAAINGEREKARKAKTELENLLAQSRRIAISASLGAALFSLASGILLLRGMRKPIDALLKGTDEIALGNLDYRIKLKSRDEFGYLASHFNQMARKLEHQQHKLRETRAALEQRVAERTAELNRLNDELKRQDQARRELFADISHELRTPITVIRGEAEVTLRGEQRDAEEYKDALQRIVELSSQLGKYVNDLLFLARAETTHFQFEWESLDLVELVTGAAEDIQVMAKEKNLSVSLEAPDHPLWVRGDKQRLRQVLFILGDNACRYSDPGGRIALAFRTTPKEVSVSMTDRGIGIPSQDLERIFDRHFRSKNALHSRDDGSGLGLPMARSILKAHGGRIAVTSNENAGSTFTITLPFSSPDQE